MPIGARFARYFNPVLDALRALGGSARPGEVCDWIAEHLRITAEERDQENPSGGSKFENDVAWARLYLVRSGYLDSSRRGVWSLTEQGRNAETLSDDQIAEVIRVVQALVAPDPGVSVPTDDQIEQVVIQQAEQAAPEDVSGSYREQILEILLDLPPAGFERLCQRLLRESGFQQVRPKFLQAPIKFDLA